MSRMKMFGKFVLRKMNSSHVDNPEIMRRYSTLGYFTYSYLKSLDSTRWATDIVKNKQVQRVERSIIQDGRYISISIANLKYKAVMNYLLLCPEKHAIYTIGDIMDAVQGIFRESRLEDDSDIYIKFEMFHRVGGQEGH